MNTRFKDVFRGKVVNKRLTVNTGVDEFPRFVVEYLIDNYCTEENFQEDLQQVIKRLRENFVHGAEAEKIRHQIRETRNHNIIANLEVRLQETEDKYWGTIGAINESFVNVTESLVRQYPMLLSGGMWGTITLTYDETEVHNKKIRPFKVTEFTPFQISVIDLNEYIEKRKQFEADEWLDFLINSIGFNPEQSSRREKLLYLWRLVPMAEANCNTIELAPRETGKTYIYRNQSYYATVLSGGKATPAGLFINNATGKVGVVGSRDAVVFDEIANTDFTDPKALVSIMQGYMQDAKFSRGKKEILAFASIVLVGNIDIQAKLPHEKYYHLFEPLPDFLQVEAFIDRLHGYLPGWEIPKIHPGSLAQDYGFITDYFCEIMHELRRKDVLGALKGRYQLMDTSTAKAGITGRDVRGVEKVLSGLLKLMYPHGEVNDEQLAELLSIAIEGRQRVRNQLHLMAAGEYGPVVLTGKLTQSGKLITPTLPDAQRQQKVTLPSSPRIGEVIGLAVIGGDRGCLLHFEMQATKGIRPDHQSWLDAEGDEGECRRRRSVHQDARQGRGPTERLAGQLRHRRPGNDDGRAEGRTVCRNHHRHRHRLGSDRKGHSQRHRHDWRNHDHGQGACHRRRAAQAPGSYRCRLHGGHHAEGERAGRADDTGLRQNKIKVQFVSSIDEVLAAALLSPS